MLKCGITGSSGVLGKFPEAFEAISERDRVTKVIELSRRLVMDELVKMHDIAVLCEDEDIARQIRLDLAKNRMPSSLAKDAGNAFIVDTVANFKGLESAFVLLVLGKSSARNQEYSYVGISRARTHLFIIGTIHNTDVGSALESARVELIE